MEEKSDDAVMMMVKKMKMIHVWFWNVSVLEFQVQQ